MSIESASLNLLQVLGPIDWSYVFAHPKYGDQAQRIKDAMEFLDKSIPAHPQWLPIETAPKDGTKIIALFNGTGDMYQSYWNSDQDTWWDINHDCYYVSNPTHWMQLPEIPKQSNA